MVGMLRFAHPTRLSGLFTLPAILTRRCRLARACKPRLGHLPIGVEISVVGLQLHAGPLLADEGDQAFRIGEALVAEGDHRALRPGIDLLDAGLAAKSLDLDHVEQVLHLLRQRAEAVDQLGGEGLDGIVALDRRQPAIEPEPHLQVGT